MGVCNVKLGVVGTGMIAQIVVPHLETWGCPIGAICGTPSSRDEVDKLCCAYGGEAYTDMATMLEQADIDTVYIAVPNVLHASFAKQALRAGKHVIVEKPFASNVTEVQALADLARERGLLIYEAISTLYLPNFEKIRELLPRIGDIRIVSCNYSQYSSRYDAFRAGEMLPAFDPAKSGGALMDLGLYNMHYLIGLFGEPNAASYHANVERGVDTSGVMELDYGSFKAVSIAAKDCAAPASYVIQGNAGYLRQTTPANNCGVLTLHLNDGTEEVFDLNPELQWESEFRAFAQGIDENDQAGCYRMLEHSIVVSRTMTAARLAAGVRFAADEG